MEWAMSLFPPTFLFPPSFLFPQMQRAAFARREKIAAAYHPLCLEANILNPLGVTHTASNAA
jgi:hypothetical protein